MTTLTPPTGVKPQFDVALAKRRLKGAIFIAVGLISIAFALGTLLVLIVDIIGKGAGWLDWQFITSFDSRFPERAGIKAALFGTVYMMVLTIAVSFPIGVMAAVYLEEYARNNWFTNLVQINITNLAGVPSIIYGLLGLQVFVRWLTLDRSVLAGALTMALLVLPLIIVAAREAIRAVPPSLRDASLALGATKFQTIWNHVLPYAFPGILTGNILAASRAIGETAPLITIGALTFVPFVPRDIFDKFTVLPILIFNWTSKPQAEFQEIAAAGILLLLAVLLTMNAAAVLLRNLFQSRMRS